LKPLSEITGEEMLTVFIPSTPTAFSGYMLVVPRKNVVELPLTVAEAMRLLVSGGVIVPTEGKAVVSKPASESPALENDPNAVVKPQTTG